jgi:hypothetical protein
MIFSRINLLLVKVNDFIMVEQLSKSEVLMILSNMEKEGIIEWK